MKTKTIIIILVVVLAIAVAVWIWAAKKPLDTSEPAAGTPEAKKANDAAATVKMPLKQGSRGDLVKAIQIALNSKFNAGLLTDGIWGSKTQSALQSAGLPTTIYWKQWSEITGNSIMVGGKIVSQEQGSIQKANQWIGTLPASAPNYFM